MKFTLDVRVEGMVNARTEQEAAADPLAAAVLALPGVAAVFRTADFLTVTREPSASWDELIATWPAPGRRQSPVRAPLGAPCTGTTRFRPGRRRGTRGWRR